MECPLYLSRRQVGIVRVMPEGRDTRFTVLAAAPPGLYRVYVTGQGGELSLGVWEGGALSRRFSRELTDRVGQISGAYAQPVADGREAWEPALENRFPGWPVEGGLCRRRGDGWQLAMPFSEEGPFPLPSLFCLARVVGMMGRQWAVFCFDDRGQPRLPSST